MSTGTISRFPVEMLQHILQDAIDGSSLEEAFRLREVDRRFAAIVTPVLLRSQRLEEVLGIHLNTKAALPGWTAFPRKLKIDIVLLRLARDLMHRSYIRDFVEQLMNLECVQVMGPEEQNATKERIIETIAVSTEIPHKLLCSEYYRISHENADTPDRWHESWATEQLQTSYAIIMVCSAVVREDTGLLNHLLSTNNFAWGSNRLGMAHMILAARCGTADIIRVVDKYQPPFQLHDRNRCHGFNCDESHPITPLTAAAESNNIFALQSWLEGMRMRTPHLGTDFLIATETCLIHAARSGKITAVEYILIASAGLRNYQTLFCTCLKAAIAGDQPETARAILARTDANPNATSRSPLVVAISKIQNIPRRAGMLRVLLENGVLPNHVHPRDTMRTTALRVALGAEDMESAGVLLDHGGRSSPNIRATPLDEHRLRKILLAAVAVGNADLIKIALDRGASPRFQFGRLEFEVKLHEPDGTTTLGSIAAMLMGVLEVTTLNQTQQAWYPHICRPLISGPSLVGLHFIGPLETQVGFHLERITPDDI
ncbi:hypothetical protein BJX99DRAFT_260974 [Aspergillus californicus]